MWGGGYDCECCLCKLSGRRRPIRKFKERGKDIWKYLFLLYPHWKSWFVDELSIQYHHIIIEIYQALSGRYPVSKADKSTCHGRSWFASSSRGQPLGSRVSSRVVWRGQQDYMHSLWLTYRVRKHRNRHVEEWHTTCGNKPAGYYNIQNYQVANSPLICSCENIRQIRSATIEEVMTDFLQKNIETHDSCK